MSNTTNITWIILFMTDEFFKDTSIAHGKRTQYDQSSPLERFNATVLVHVIGRNGEKGSPAALLLRLFVSATTAFPSAVVLVDVIIIIAIIVRGGLAGLSGCDIAKGLLLFFT